MTQKVASNYLADIIANHMPDEASCDAFWRDFEAAGLHVGFVDHAPAASQPTAWVKELVDLFFAPWGAAKAARYEAMTGDKPFDSVTVLRLIQERLAATSSDGESGCPRKCREADDSAGSGNDRNCDDTMQGSRPAAVVKVPPSEADIKCDRCGSLGDTYRLCAGCGAPVPQSAAIAAAPVALTREEALQESQYLAGLKAGWNFGLTENREGYDQAVKGREGYLAGLKNAAPTISPEPSIDLQKVADVIEPHWRGAGVELTADWVIAEYIGLGKELEETRAQLEASPEPDAVRALFEPAEINATDNLEGALIDIKRYSEAGLPPDKVCIRTIERVIEQLTKAEAALSRPAHGGWEEALKPLAGLYDQIDDRDADPDTDVFFQHDGTKITFGDIRRAHALLARNQGQGGGPRP